MKCFYHEEKDAVATCQVCGKSLCKECAGKYTPCMCEGCYEEEVKKQNKEKSRNKKDALIDTNAELIKAIIIGLISYYIINKFIFTGDSSMDGLFSLMPFFLPFGWSLITYFEQWLPTFFLGGAFLFIYLIVKFGVSMVIGIPCFFYQIVLYAVRMYKIKKI